MDPNQKKGALRKLTYGLYVATSKGADHPAAGTINWLSQCSFDPPLVMVGIQHDSNLHQAIGHSRVFAIHVVGKSQKNMATSFFRGAEEDAGKLNGYAYILGSTGAPLLLDAPAWFECRVVDSLERGDHTIFVGEIIDAGVRSDEDPLTMRDAGFNYAG
jgi:flavin reductase (DIM6/NTAB) family NADH-FMN oxidoreductase RutF